MRFQTLILGAATLALASTGSAKAELIRVTITNTSPIGGEILSPLWVGFQDGTHPAFTVSAAASIGVAQISQDGINANQTALFAGNGAQGTLPGGPLKPGGTATMTFNVDTSGSGRYLDYLSMVVLSNDFFIGNASPTAIDLSKLKPGQTLTLLGGVPNAGATAGAPNIVYDSGTEINDFNFSLGNAAFGLAGGQTAPGQGNAENGVIHAVTGDPFASFLNTPAGFTSGNLNFNNPALYSSVALITITDVPEPVSIGVFAAGLLGLARARRRAV